MEITFKTSLDAIQLAVSNNKTSLALRKFSQCLNKPFIQGVFETEWNEVFRLLWEISKADFGEQVQATLQVATLQPNHPEVLYKVGYAFIEADRPDLATGILGRAAMLAPENAKFLVELVSALELQGRNEEIVQILDQKMELVASDPLLLYLRAFNAILVGDINYPLTILSQLKQLEQEPFPHLVDRLERILARANAVQEFSPLTAQNLRGWHFVLTGGILLKQAKDKQYNGRFGQVWDSPKAVKEVINRLAKVLEILEIAPPAVLFPPESNSEITAQSIASLMQIKTGNWLEEQAKGLLVVYDARNLIPEYRKLLVHHQAEQPLFMMAAQYNKEQATAPDFIGYLYQRNTSPWGPGLTETYEVIDTGDATPQDLAKEVVAAEIEQDQEDLKDLLEFVRGLKKLFGLAQASTYRTSGQRERIWIGSPVPNS